MGGLQIACVYHDRPVPDLTVASMNYIRLFRMAEALAGRGHHVDIVIDRRPEPVVTEPRLREIPFRHACWDDYDVIKTFFHDGFAALRAHGGERHPFIVSKLGSVVGRDQESRGQVPPTARRLERRPLGPVADDDVDEIAVAREHALGHAAQSDSPQTLGHVPGRGRDVVDLVVLRQQAAGVRLGVRAVDQATARVAVDEHEARHAVGARERRDVTHEGLPPDDDDVRTTIPDQREGVARERLAFELRELRVGRLVGCAVESGDAEPRRAGSAWSRWLGPAGRCSGDDRRQRADRVSARGEAFQQAGADDRGAARLGWQRADVEEIERGQPHLSPGVDDADGEPGVVDRDVIERRHAGNSVAPNPSLTLSPTS